jgi:hypothetical protein
MGEEWERNGRGMEAAYYAQTRSRNGGLAAERASYIAPTRSLAVLTRYSTSSSRVIDSSNTPRKLAT